MEREIIQIEVGHLSHKELTKLLKLTRLEQSVDNELYKLDPVFSEEVSAKKIWKLM